MGDLQDKPTPFAGVSTFIFVNAGLRASTGRRNLKILVKSFNCVFGLCFRSDDLVRERTLEMGDLGEEPTPFAGIGFLKRRLDRGHPKVAGLWIDILEDGVASFFLE
jgi:hypothetical protein